MKDPIGRMYARRDLGDRLNDSGFVVCRHHRNERAPARVLMTSKKVLERRQVDNAVAIHRNEFDLRGCEAPACADGRMFDAGHEQHVSANDASANVKLGSKRGSVGFSCSARERDRSRVRPDEFRNLFPGTLDRGAGRTPFGMDGGRIAERKRRLHGGFRGRPQRRGRVMIEIGAFCRHFRRALPVKPLPTGRVFAICGFPLVLLRATARSGAEP